MQEEETKRRNLRAGKCGRDCNVKGIIIIIIKIIIILGCRSKDGQNP